MRRFNRLTCLAAVGALLIGLGLGGCGRKGGLDAPPSAAVVEAPPAPAAASPTDGLLFGRPDEPPPPQAPAGAPAPNRTFFLDWLVN